MIKEILYYPKGECHFIEAGSIDQLQKKCKPFIADPSVEKIEVVQPVGFLKQKENWE